MFLSFALTVSCTQQECEPIEKECGGLFGPSYNVGEEVEDYGGPCDYCVCVDPGEGMAATIECERIDCPDAGPPDAAPLPDASVPVVDAGAPDSGIPDADVADAASADGE